MVQVGGRHLRVSFFIRKPPSIHILEGLSIEKLELFRSRVMDKNAQFLKFRTKWDYS